jgi:integrase
MLGFLRGVCRHIEIERPPAPKGPGPYAFWTAMRDSEMRHLTWGQIDFLKQILTVGKSKTAAGSGRTIPLNSAVLVALADHMRWYEKRVGAATAESYVFPFGKARHWDASRPMKTLKTAWRNGLRKAKVKIRLHDLRHTVITKLTESGASDETIMAIAGHVSRRMLSRYAHIRTEAKRRALEAVTRLTLFLKTMGTKMGTAGVLST